MGRILYEGAERSDLTTDDWLVLDGYLVSVTDIFEQLYREVREGILEDGALTDFTGLGLFQLPYYKTSWHTTYKQFMSPSFVEYFDKRSDIVAGQSER